MPLESQLESLISRSKQSCHAISSLRFLAPGIFANSIIKNNEVTNVITDLNITMKNASPKPSNPQTSDSSSGNGSSGPSHRASPEQQYSTGPQLKKRKRNSSLFLTYDSRNQVLRRYDYSAYREDEAYYYRGDFLNDQVTVKVPQMPVLDELSMADNITYLNKLGQINTKLQGILTQRLSKENLYNWAKDEDEEEQEEQEGDTETKDEKAKNSRGAKSNEEERLIESMIEIILKLNDSYPISNIEQYLEKLKQENVSTNIDIEECKAIYKEIKKHLKKYSQDFNDKDIIEYQRSIQASSRENKASEAEEREAEEREADKGENVKEDKQVEKVESGPMEKLSGAKLIQAKKKELEQLKLTMAKLQEEVRG